MASPPLFLGGQHLSPLPQPGALHSGVRESREGVDRNTEGRGAVLALPQSPPGVTRALRYPVTPTGWPRVGWRPQEKAQVKEQVGVDLCPFQSQPRIITLFFNFLGLNSKASSVSRPDLGDLPCGSQFPCKGGH